MKINKDPKTQHAVTLLLTVRRGTLHHYISPCTIQKVSCMYISVYTICSHRFIHIIYHIYILTYIYIYIRICIHKAIVFLYLKHACLFQVPLPMDLGDLTDYLSLLRRLRRNKQSDIQRYPAMVPCQRRSSLFGIGIGFTHFSIPPPPPPPKKKKKKLAASFKLQKCMIIFLKVILGVIVDVLCWL